MTSSRINSIAQETENVQPKEPGSRTLQDGSMSLNK